MACALAYRLRALLRQIRREAALTQVEVAARLDVLQSFVSKYETEERRPDVVELRHVSQTIGTTLGDVMSRLCGHGCAAI